MQAMGRSHILRAVTGLAAGALLTAGLLGVFALGSLAKIPLVPFTVFDSLIRILPGSVVNFGLDITVRTLNGLGFNIKNTAKTAEEVLAIAILFIAGLVVGLLFFVLVRTESRSRTTWYGVAVGAGLGVLSALISLLEGVRLGVGGTIGFVIWVVALFVLWGWGMALLYRLTVAQGAIQTGTALAAGADPSIAGGAEPATQVSASRAPVTPVEAYAISRRRFVVQMGGLAATIIVVGAGVGALLRAETRPGGEGTSTPPVAFPNADSPVEPALGTRPEYTAVADHYRVDIDLSYPEIDEATWRLAVDGLVRTPMRLTLADLKSGFNTVDQFVTLSCISNMLGGPLIGTTLWTGVPLRQVLAGADPLPEARWARIISADGFDEEVELERVDSDPRIILAYAWDGRPLPPEHGFPLRVCVPDRYGMKQPKWITRISLTAESNPGYWVRRNWEERAEVKTTAVIDTVATKSLVTREGKVYIPIGGIAYSGAKGISRVEIQIDDAPWQAAALREPLSGLTWVIWRYDWPFTAGTHWLAVRAYDGAGRLQVTEETVSAVGTAVTGLFREYRTIEPIEPTEPS
jgi:DMSO/TMAO reductase YedYZ molybdopterin-dependent catalytic subunit